ncbi:MAG: hypothetical protein ACOY46_10645 [Bacillota bacterium]
MRIEILTRLTEKKPGIMTYLRGMDAFRADGDKVTAIGIEAEFADNYILLKIFKPWMADELIRMLFNVQPVPFSTGFYEIYADHRIIVTSAAKPLTEIIEHLDVLEHLDLEEGELAGNIEIGWTSRDVGITAVHQLIVDGSVAVSRIKFKTHFRESEHHCKNALSRVSIIPGLSLYSKEYEGLSKPPEISPLLFTASSTVDSEKFSVIINGCYGRISYNEGAGLYEISLGEGNNIILSKTGGKNIDLKIRLEKPWTIGEENMDILGSISGINRGEIKRCIAGLTIGPDDLIKRLGFAKEKEFLAFSAKLGNLKARYDIGRREMDLTVEVPWDDLSRSQNLFKMVDAFTARVMEYAG